VAHCPPFREWCISPFGERLAEALGRPNEVSRAMCQSKPQGPVLDGLVLCMRASPCPMARRHPASHRQERSVNLRCVALDISDRLPSRLVHYPRSGRHVKRNWRTDCLCRSHSVVVAVQSLNSFLERRWILIHVIDNCVILPGEWPARLGKISGRQRPMKPGANTRRN
jgi:hypothetical protein